MELENWKDIEGYENQYQVSNKGRIKNKIIGEYLKPLGSTNKYYLSQQHRQEIIHRIVAKHFIPNPDNLPYVIHLDGDITNNTVTNLKWANSKIRQEHEFKLKQLNLTNIPHDTETERWKDIENFEKQYMVSDNGKILNIINNKELKPVCHKSLGHLVVVLCRNGISNHFTVQYLVAKHFIDNPNNLPSILHKDGNKTNNHFTNLQWISNQDLKKHIMKKKIDQFVPPKDTEDEKWLPIKGYENYIISTKSRIINKETGREMQPTLSGGYYSVNLSNLLESKKAKLFRVHRLVAITFGKKETEKKIYVDHKDNNKTNNNADNLRWATPAENSNSYIKKHRISPSMIILQYDANMNLIKEWNSMKEILEANSNYCKFNIYRCLAMNFKYPDIVFTSYNYIWKYKNKKVKTIELKPDEEFKNIGIIEGKDLSNYKISNYGAIRSIQRNQYLETKNNLYGYPAVNLPDKNLDKSYNLSVHTLVAWLFIGEKPGQNYEVNHKDENKTNNYYKNLEWLTNKDNIRHSHSKKINQIDPETNEIIKTFDAMIDAVKTIGLKGNGGISKCCNGKAQTAGGYKWAYAE